MSPNGKIPNIVLRVAVNAGVVGETLGLYLTSSHNTSADVTRRFARLKFCEVVELHIRTLHLKVDAVE